jgi:hypothetical protein
MGFWKFVHTILTFCRSRQKAPCVFVQNVKGLWEAFIRRSSLPAPRKFYLLCLPFGAGHQGARCNRRRSADEAQISHKKAGKFWESQTLFPKGSDSAERVEAPSKRNMAAPKYRHMPPLTRRNGSGERSVRARARVCLATHPRERIDMKKLVVCNFSAAQYPVRLLYLILPQFLFRVKPFYKKSSL